MHIIIVQTLLCNVGDNWWLVIKQVYSAQSSTVQCEIATDNVRVHHIIVKFLLAIVKADCQIHVHGIPHLAVTIAGSFSVGYLDVIEVR